jgi:DNA primase
VIFPSFNEKGKVNYFVARNYVDDFRKYMNPDASKDIVFNELYIDWSSDVVLVEGIFDAVKAENAIPILGSTLREDSKLFAKIIEKDPALYIALDPDAEKKAAKIINSLLSYDIELYKIPIPSNKDVGDMTKEEFQEYKSQARLIKNTDYVLLNKIMSL